MSDQKEEVEILVEDEPSSKAQATSFETNIKRKEKPEKKKGIFKSEWVCVCVFYPFSRVRLLVIR